MAFALKVDHLRKTYPSNVAVDDVSFTIEEGEFFGFLGPNGAGKTTTIGCITGLTTITSGTIEVFGYNVVKNYREARRSIGLSPQDFNFDIFRSAADTLVYNAGFFGIPRGEAKSRVEELLKRFELWDHRDKPFNQLSGGMKRRLALARALIHKPKLLILDEPTAGVDVELRRSLWKELKAIQATGTTVLLTTHYLEEAEQLCERVAIIHRGKIQVIERVDELKKQHNDKSLEDIFLELTAKEPAAGFAI